MKNLYGENGIPGYEGNIEDYLTGKKLPRSMQYSKDSSLHKKPKRIPCSDCGRIPVRISTLELSEGREYAGALDFMPVFKLLGAGYESKEVQPNIDIGYSILLDENIRELLNRISQSPAGTQISLIDSTSFEVFDIPSGRPITLAAQNAGDLCSLAMTGVQAILSSPRLENADDSPLNFLLGLNSQRFYANQICIPTTEELMSFLRSQWRK